MRSRAVVVLDGETDEWYQKLQCTYEKYLQNTTVVVSRLGSEVIDFEGRNPGQCSRAFTDRLKGRLSLSSSLFPSYHTITLVLYFK